LRGPCKRDSPQRHRGHRVSSLRSLCLCGEWLALFWVFSATALAQNPIHWSITSSEKGPIVVGDTFSVDVAARIDSPWHLYAPTQLPGGPIPLVLSVPFNQPFTQLGEIDFPLPKSVVDPNFNLETQFYEEHAVFTVPIQVESAKDGRHVLTVTTSFQTCNDRICLPPTEQELKLAVVIGKDAGGQPRVTEVTPEPPVINSAASAGVEDMAAASAKATTLLGYVSLAMLMGALSLLTPCVFPMVPITVSYFTNRAGRSRREAVMQAVVYGLGIILTFTAVGFAIAVGFGASGLNTFAADPWLNLAITGLFVAFALSLFGVYELALPSKLVSMAAKADEGRGRYVGTLLMGLAFTLTSFTCTAPFLGALFVVASQGDWQWPLAGMLAFSSVFALPFIVLALAPQLLASLPRSGMWLVGVKAAMGLLELGAAMKFISNADLVWGWGVFTRNVVIVSWIVVIGALAIYLAGLIKLGIAPRLGRPGPARVAMLVLSVVLLVWLASGLTGRRLGELEAFLPPAESSAMQSGELSWVTNDYEAALADAKKQNRPILVDFTGYTCTNCRWMEANMFPRPEVSRELARYVRVRLYTDGRGELYRRYQEMERQIFGTVALPYYAVLAPDGKPVVAFGGLTRDPNEYLNFLRRGLE
jgi:thiol:disulfide interchange protein